MDLVKRLLLSHFEKIKLFHLNQNWELFHNKIKTPIFNIFYNFLNPFFGIFELRWQCSKFWLRWINFIFSKWLSYSRFTKSVLPSSQVENVTAYHPSTIYALDTRWTPEVVCWVIDPSVRNRRWMLPRAIRHDQGIWHLDCYPGKVCIC